MDKEREMERVDWVAIIDASFRDAFLHVLCQLPFDRLRNQPPPRRGGLPFGFEPYILIRYLRGQSCHLLPSGFSGLYRR